MRELLLTMTLALAGCFTRQDCFEGMKRHYEDLEREGGILEVCPPDKDMAIVHLDGPPHVVTPCLPAEFDEKMPDCESLPLRRASDAEAAICRAQEAFPEDVSALGANPRVAVEGAGGEWRVRFGSAGGKVPRRGILVIVDPHDEYDAIGIRWTRRAGTRKTPSPHD